jgi:hypothetical protein
MARTILARPNALLLQRVQPTATRLLSGSLSTLAPLSGFSHATHPAHYTLFAVLAAAVGGGRNNGFSQGSFPCAVPTPSSAWLAAD